MDKKFWLELDKTKYDIPEGHTLSELTREVFSYLSSTDPELRDDIGFTAFANWLNQERYSAEEISAYTKDLLTNLETGIGQIENDSVFLRTFSILLLAEILYNDHKKNLFNKTEVDLVLEKSLSYITAEKDPRGYVPIKGWAHALAHTADLFRWLSKNSHLEESGLLKILKTISEKIINSTNYIYIHGEDERLASAIIEILRRDMLPVETVEAWANSFIEPEWKGAYTDANRNCAFQNTRNLLRSIYIELQKDSGELTKKAVYQTIFLEAIKSLKSF